MVTAGLMTYAFFYGVYLVHYSIKQEGCNLLSPI